MRELRLEYTFAVDVETAACSIFGGVDFPSTFHTEIENTNFNASSWHAPPLPSSSTSILSGSPHRILEYDSPIRAPSLLKAYLGESTAVVETQVLSLFPSPAAYASSPLAATPWPLNPTPIATGPLPPLGASHSLPTHPAKWPKVAPHAVVRVDVVNRFRSGIGPYIVSEGCYLLAQGESDAETHVVITARVGWAGSFLVQTPMEAFMISSATSAFETWAVVAAEYFDQLSCQEEGVVEGRAVEGRGVEDEDEDDEDEDEDGDEDGEEKEEEERGALALLARLESILLAVEAMDNRIDHLSRALVR